MVDSTPPSGPAPAASYDQGNVHNKLGLLTRQLHDALSELGYAEKLRGSADKLPDAQNRLTYIARLTGEAAEKVLGLVDDAKDRQTVIVDETKRMRQAMIADPVAAVAKGHIMNYLEHMEEATEIVDNQLTDIMMAQDFHDLTGQVIAKVVALAGNLEEQLVQLLLQTAPPGSADSAVASANNKAAAEAAQAAEMEAAAAAQASATETPAYEHPPLSGPVVDPENTPDVVTSQSQVDDLLASLGF